MKRYLHAENLCATEIWDYQTGINVFVLFKSSETNMTAHFSAFTTKGGGGRSWVISWGRVREGRFVASYDTLTNGSHIIHPMWLINHLFVWITARYAEFLLSEVKLLRTYIRPVAALMETWGLGPQFGTGPHLAPIWASPTEIKSTLLLYCEMNTHSQLYI